MVQRMVTQLDQLALLNLIHIDVLYLTMPLFYAAEIKVIELALVHIVVEKSRNTDFFLIPSLFFNHYITAILKTLLFWMSY